MVSYSNCAIGSATVVTYGILLVMYKRAMKKLGLDGQKTLSDQDAKVNQLVMIVVLCTMVFYVLPNICLFYVVEVAHLVESIYIGQ